MASVSSADRKGSPSAAACGANPIRCSRSPGHSCAYAASITAATRAALREVDAREREHQSNHPPGKRGLTAEQQDTLYRETLAHSAQGQRIRAERDRLLRVALDLDHDEPEDLLELLATSGE